MLFYYFTFFDFLDLILFGFILGKNEKVFFFKMRERRVRETINGEKKLWRRKENQRRSFWRRFFWLGEKTVFEREKR